MLMNCLESWLYEIAGFLAGIISEVELGAQSVAYQLAAVNYTVTAFLLRSGFFGVFFCFYVVIHQKNNLTTMYVGLVFFCFVFGLLFVLDSSKHL